MQFVIERAALLSGLEKVVPVVPGRSDIPILRHIVVSTGAQSISMRATDTDMEISVIVPAEVAEQGVGTLPARTLYEITRRMPKEGQVSITGGQQAKVVSGRSRFTLDTLHVDDMPTLDAGAGGTLFEMPCEQLRAAFEATQHAIGTDQMRYCLGGVHLCVKGEHVHAVATDGHRLSLKKVPLPPQAHSMPPVIVPQGTVRMVLKILPDSETMCELCVTETRITFRVGETVLISKLIAGTYPDYMRVIPAAHLGCAIVPREPLARAVARVAIVLDEKKNAVRLRFSGGAVIVSGGGSCGGNSGREEISDATFDAEAVTIGVNSLYLKEALEALGGAQLAIKTDTANTPMLLEEVDGDGSHIVVLMPMRVEPDLIEDK